jgi:hypothetical protein
MPFRGMTDAHPDGILPTYQTLEITWSFPCTIGLFNKMMSELTLLTLQLLHLLHWVGHICHYLMPARAYASHQTRHHFTGDTSL